MLSLFGRDLKTQDTQVRTHTPTKDKEEIVLLFYPRENWIERRLGDYTLT